MFELDTGLIFWNLVSFALLVFLMYRWVLPPLLAVISERQRQIAETVRAAEAERRRADEIVAAARQQAAEADDAAKKIVERATADGETIKNEMSDAARREAEATRLRAREDFQREKNEALLAIRRQTADLVIAAAGRVLKKQIDKAGNEALIEECINECRR